MPKQQKFLVRIPLPETPDKADKPDKPPDEFSEHKFSEHKFSEHKFTTIKEIANFLEVTPNTIYSLRTKRLKLKHADKKKLQGITIEKINVYYPSKKNEVRIKEEINEYRKRKCG
jgi:hypothetical protein